MHPSNLNFGQLLLQIMQLINFPLKDIPFSLLFFFLVFVCLVFWGFFLRGEVLGFEGFSFDWLGVLVFFFSFSVYLFGFVLFYQANLYSCVKRQVITSESKS